jgi:hypothetical protein
VASWSGTQERQHRLLARAAQLHHGPKDRASSARLDKLMKLIPQKAKLKKNASTACLRSGPLIPSRKSAS